MKSCHQKCVFSSISQCRQYKSAITERPCGICPSFQENQRGILFLKGVPGAVSPSLIVTFFFSFSSSVPFVRCIVNPTIYLSTLKNQLDKKIKRFFVLFCFIFLFTCGPFVLSHTSSLYEPPYSALLTSSRSS